MLNRECFVALVLALVFLETQLFSQVVGRVPDEYEGSGGVGLALGNAAIAAAAEQSAIRLCPATMVFSRNYSLNYSYHWPSVGKGYYQVGLLDSKTAPVAVGVLYSSPIEKYSEPEPNLSQDERFHATYSSLVDERVTIGVANPVGPFSVGLGVQLLRIPDGERSRRGNSLSLSFAGPISRAFRFAFSASGIGNREVSDFAPATTRAGLAYFAGKAISVHMDYKSRARVRQELLHSPSSNEGSSAKGDVGLGSEKAAAERMLVASLSLKLQNVLQVMGAYSQEVSGEKRRSFSGGVSLTNQRVSISYMVNRPYLTDEFLHQAVNLSYYVNI